MKMRDSRCEMIFVYVYKALDEDIIDFGIF